MKMNIKNIAGSILITISMSSCSTILSGTKQNIQINSEPSGAKIMINGIEKGKTPSTVRVKKSMDGESISLVKEGYETKTFQPEPSFNEISVLNLFNLIFWAIDFASGSLWKYDPKYYMIELTPKKD